MPIVEWGKEFDIIGAQGTLTLNLDNEGSESQGYFLIDPAASQSDVGLRVTKDNIPQQDGWIFHRRFTEGFVATIKVWFYEPKGGLDVPTEYACENGSLRAMTDDLARVLRGLVDPGDAVSRVIYDVTGGTRLMDDIRLMGYGPVVLEGAGYSQTFIIDSPYPYTMDFAQITTQFRAGSLNQDLNNVGSAPFYPVAKVYGPVDFFVLSNNSTQLELHFDSSLPGGAAIPGGGDYVEFDFFRNTAFLNGDGASYLPSIDIEASDFWTLLPGPNDIEVTGVGTFPAPDVDILWQAAWF